MEELDGAGVAFFSGQGEGVGAVSGFYRGKGAVFEEGLGEVGMIDLGLLEAHQCGIAFGAFCVDIGAVFEKVNEGR